MKNIMKKLKTFYGESIRVLKVTRKPGKEEYITVVKASGLGILIIGAIGFIIYLLSIPLASILA